MENQSGRPLSKSENQRIAFSIAHGSPTVPVANDSENDYKGIQSSEKGEVLSTNRRRGPRIPPRRSSKSFLRHVTTVYTSGTSLAEYSSTHCSSSPIQAPESKNLRKELPEDKELSVRGRLRRESNDALRHLTREITHTNRSDVWSFETTSEASMEDVLTSTYGGDAQSTAHTQPPRFPNGTRFNASTNRIRKVRSVYQEHLSDKFRHMPQNSVSEDVQAQFFGIQPAGCHSRDDKLEMLPSSRYSMPVSNSAKFAALPAATSTTEALPASKPQLSCMASATSQWSDLSRWSDEYDKFPSANDVTSTQQSKHLPSIVPTLRTPAHDARSNSLPHLHVMAADKSLDYSEHERPGKTVHFTQVGGDTDSVIDITSHDHPRCADRKSPGNSFFTSDIASSGQLLEYKTRFASSSNCTGSVSVPRQLLPPGVAAQNAEHAPKLLAQIQENLSQLIFEERVRSTGLRDSIGENTYLREELEIARQGIRERDAEIKRLRALCGDRVTASGTFAYDVTTTMPPSSSHPPFAFGQHASSHENANNTQYASSVNAGSDHTKDSVPRYLSSTPIYDHVLPNQRILPRKRPAPPPTERDVPSA